MEMAPGRENEEREIQSVTREQLERDAQSLKELIDLREKRIDQMRKQLESGNLSERTKTQVERDLLKLMALQDKQQEDLRVLRERIRRMKEREKNE